MIDWGSDEITSALKEVDEGYVYERPKTQDEKLNILKYMMNKWGHDSIRHSKFKHIVKRKMKEMIKDIRSEIGNKGSLRAELEKLQSNLQKKPMQFYPGVGPVGGPGVVVGEERSRDAYRPRLRRRMKP